LNRYDLQGRCAIVTGGAGDIGQAIARFLLASGAKVSLWDASPHVHRLAAPDGARWVARQLDVTDAAAVDAAAREDAKVFGRIDVLVCNAGILGKIAPLWEASVDDLRRVLDVNLLGGLLCARAVLPIMRAQLPQPHCGHIVYISSANGKEGKANSSAYSASKSGLIGLTKALAKEVVSDKILVNCITPSAVRTALSAGITPERLAETVRHTPMGRLLELEEIARMVAMLCSDDCSFSTGATFDLSGGRTTY
jgi:3-oxoacyl-[acyl-carrier protein] reductase